MTTTTFGCGVAFVLVAGLGMSAGTTAAVGGVVQGQAQNPCSLLTSDEVRSLAPKDTDVGNGVSASSAPDASSCRYTWGSGNNRYALAVSVAPAARVYAGMTADSIKQAIASSVVPETADAAISEVGDAAAFKAYSPAFAVARAHVKDQILEVNLDGIDAREKKSQLISLLKSAASRM